MIKLYYFQGAGRAEAIRLLLTHAGKKFQDIRFTNEEWQKEKPKFETGQLPALEYKGKMLCQSYAIMEFLGAKFGYLPKDYDKLYKCMMIMNTSEDLFMKAFRATSSWSPLDAKAKEEALKTLLTTEGPLFMKAIDKIYKENDCKDFIVGHDYTVADFFLIGFYVSVKTVPEFQKAFEEKLKKDFPDLVAYAEKRLLDFSIYYKKCKPKLYYFNMPGRAEMIRLMFKHMKMPFEDIQFSFEEWKKTEKKSGKFELEQLPAVSCESCGIKLVQSDAIMHRIGLRAGYLPIKKPTKLYDVVWFCNTLKDLMDGIARIAFAENIPEEKKKTMRADFFKQAAIFFGAMENKLKGNKSQDFLVGRSYTIADFYYLGAYRGFFSNPGFGEFKVALEKCPLLSAYCEKRLKDFA